MEVSAPRKAICVCNPEIFVEVGLKMDFPYQAAGEAFGVKCCMYQSTNAVTHPPPIHHDLQPIDQPPFVPFNIHLQDSTNRCTC